MRHEKIKEKYARSLELKIEEAINTHCLEEYSDTPDFILAEYLRRCLDNFNETMQVRDKWYGAKQEDE